MAYKDLTDKLDGGPHDDPREKEDKELLDDGEVEEKDSDESWAAAESAAGEIAPKSKEGKKEADVEADVEEKPDVEAEEKEETEEEVAKTEKETETDAEAAAEAKEDEKTKYQTIPYPRFRKELTKRHQLAADLARSQGELAELRERMSKFEGAAQQAINPEPDAMADPLGHTQWEVKQLRQELAARSNPEPADTISPAESAALFGIYRESAAAFEEEHPDFMAAYKHILNVAAADLRLRYPNSTTDQLVAAVQAAEMREVKNVLAHGIDPAERVYELATLNGYRPEKTTVEEKTTIRDKVVGAAAEAARKRRAASLATGGQTATKRPLTDADIDDMSNEELVKHMDRNSGRKNPLAP